MIDPKYLNIDGIIKATAPIEIKQQYFIEKAKEVYGDRYLYDKVEYKSAKTKVIIGCRIHGDFLAIPNNHLSNAGGCPECAGNIKLTRETFQSKIDQLEFKYCKEFQYDRITGYWALNAAWEGLYNVISTSNAALESLDKYAAHITNEADRKKYAEYTAEVRFIRAFSYFRIVNLWGNAPLLLNNQELNLVKSSREEIYNFIYSELEYCVANLPALRPNEQTNKLGAVTRYTAQALLAKAYLYNENWDGVLAATNDIISSNKFSLYNDFYQLFKIPGKLSNESLFELQYTDFAGGIVTGKQIGRAHV